MTEEQMELACKEMLAQDCTELVTRIEAKSREVVDALYKASWEDLRSWKIALKQFLNDAEEFLVYSEEAIEQEELRKKKKDAN
jgi:hypothetical protein